jgi:hypothetical protein
MKPSSSTPGGKARGAHIERNQFHDAGAYAQCSYCRRYSDNVDSILRMDFPCDCGEEGGWSGSFRRPDEDSRWSEAK